MDVHGKTDPFAAAAPSAARFAAGVFEGDLGRRLFHGMADGCAIHELLYDEGRPVDYLFLAVNPAFERKSGLCAEQVVGRTVREVLPSVDVRRLDDYDRVVRTGEPIRFETYDELYGLHLSVAAFKTGERQFAITFADVSERVRSVEALRESQARLSSIFRAAPVGVGLTIDRVLSEVNDRVCRISGYTREELIGKSAAMLYTSTEEYERVGREKYGDIRRRGIGTVECQWRRKDGELIDVRLSSTPLARDDLGKGVTFTVLDITDQKRAAGRREELERQLVHAQKLEAIGTLAAGIAHDFNNILSAVTGYAELARDGVDEGSSAAEDLAEVLRAGQRARDLVGQILAFSRSDEAPRSNVELAPIVREAALLLRRSIPTSIALDVSVDEDCAPVFAEATRIHQVVVNLVTNAYHAVQASDVHGSEGRIEVVLEEVDVDPASDRQLATLHPGPHARVVVRDNGPGMAAATRARIFDPYFTTKSPGKGTGLGLAIVHGIVSSAGGAIAVHTEPGRGTEFAVYLPVAQDEPNEEWHLGGEAGELHGSERVFVVDDDEAVRRMAVRMLKRFGYAVTALEDGRAALEAFEAAPQGVDVVVTDLAMPHMTGIQLSRALLQRRPELPIILCTGFAGSVSPETVRSMGIRELALKPIVGSELAALVRRVLE